MPEDRLERLLGELSSEIESRREEDRARLAEWFANLLNAEYNRSAVQVNLVEQLRQGHGLDAQGDDEESTER
jgi:hypothetical protein